MNDENLRDLRKLTTSEQREFALKGNKASQEARKKQKALRELFQEFCSMKPTAKEMEQLQKMGYDPKDVTNMTSWVVSLFKNGAKGNNKALEISLNLIERDERELKIKRQEAEIEKLKLECEKLRQETNTGSNTYEDLTPLADLLKGDK